MMLEASRFGRIYQIFAVIFLIAFGGVNFVTSLGPEVGFDALWYHLPMAKLYLEHGGIFHIPGGLLYYSEMPRLGELLFLASLKISDFGPHLITYLAGLSGGYLTFRLARLYLPRFESLTVVVLFYCTPLVGWLSGSAYVDLLRTDFELLALFFVMKRNYTLGGLALGLAASVKYLAWTSVLPVGLVLLVAKPTRKQLIYFLTAFLFSALPWLISSFLNTGYILYPIGTGILDSRHNLTLNTLSPLTLMANLWKVFVFPEDPINPIYFSVLTIIVMNLKTLWNKYREISVFVLGGLCVWEVIPQTGGGRFILPYLPEMAVVTVIGIGLVKDKFSKNLLVMCIFGLSFVNLATRIPSLVRLKPYLLRQETKEEYLCRRPELLPGTFVDCDGQVKKLVGKDSLVVTHGIHNLYYIDVPFVDQSWYRGEKYHFVLSGKGITYSPGTLVYHSSQLGYSLYRTD